MARASGQRRTAIQLIVALSAKISAIIVMATSLVHDRVMRMTEK